MTKNVKSVVVTYNGIKWIKKCLDSLCKSSIPVDIIVIDNGSSDGTQELIKRNYKSVKFIQSQKNLGFGAANNIGLKMAYESSADYVFLLNQDAWLIEPDTIEKLIQAHEKDTTFGIISPIHLNGLATRLDYGFSIYITPKRCPALYSDQWMNSLKDSIYDVEFVNAAAWLISRSCLEKVGGFSPTFFHYGEDINYIQRVKFYNFKVGIYPFVSISHDRENRSETHVYDYGKKMAMLYSNPLLSSNLKMEIKAKFRTLLIHSIMLNLSGVKQMFADIKTLKKIRPQIESNLNLSKNGEPLCFINN
jgi:GT2 family glycosyltransferase